MGHDAAAAPSPAMPLAKKKRANRSAKLKQCKLDARREQWLSQVKGKGPKPAARERPGMSLSSPPPSGKTAGISSGSSGSSSIGSCSRSVSDAEEDSGGLDDWEAVADALSAAPPVVIPAAPIPIPIPDPVRAVPRAWRPDDAFRPQSLPNLAKQRCFPVSLERRHGDAGPGPSSCPICYEDLDPTDSSFLPCSCGFRLCLFCHKKILEADGRCPGCRKQYAPLPGGGGIALSRSCSMRSRV